MLLARVEMDPEMCLHVQHLTSHRPFVNLGNDKNAKLWTWTSCSGVPRQFDLI